jgi:protein-L-isoaspartate(D-aspartate) O-methyltransferase
MARAEDNPTGFTPEELAAMQRWQDWRDTPMYYKHAFLLEEAGLLNHPNVHRAFYSVDRADFLKMKDSVFALADTPIGIGYEQTNSQPSLVARMLDVLNPQEGEKILDVGVGSGWTTALLSYAVGPEGRVIGTERIPELVDFAKQNIAKYPIENAEVHLATKTIGRPEDAPYDAILVSAASRSVRLALVKQLKEGGRLLIPVRDNINLVTRSKSGNHRTRRAISDTQFVPLIDGPAEPK